MHRRDFLAWSCAAAASFGAGWCGLQSLTSSKSPASSGPTGDLGPDLPLNTWLEQLKGTVPLGSRYIETQGAAAQDGDSLLRTLAGRLDLDVGAMQNQSFPIASVRAAILEDFEQGRLCSSMGWQLSQTECDIAALRYRVHGERGQVTTRYQGSIEATPPVIRVCDGTGLGVATVVWSAPDVDRAEVRLHGPEGPLFAVGGVTGTAKTGKWVRNGMIFYLQDVSPGQTASYGRTLATLTVEVTDAGC